jgi:hypothetical protein
MNPEQEYVTAEAVGQALGELLGAFVTVINALRRQPGFDEGLFTTELQTILRNPELTTLQSHTFTLLMKGATEPKGTVDPQQN